MNKSELSPLYYPFNEYFDIIYFKEVFRIKSKTAYFSFSIAVNSTDLCVFLNNNNFQGKVIFDLLACNGMEDNRFIETFFNGLIFEKKYTIISYSDINLNFENEYYRNKEYIDLSGTILTEEEILQLDQ